ncbi:P-loop containing nucleoside triphosphate hydrolase protein [Pyronema omphalodes]|nr:P-loop containing nucleoside triphosphate hydrolase protein [Pyronema omphalodes]
MRRAPTPSRPKSPYSTPNARPPTPKKSTSASVSVAGAVKRTPETRDYFQIYLRLRPSTATNPRDKEFLTNGGNNFNRINATSILCTPPTGARGKADKYTFTSVFPSSAGQMEVFTTAVAPLVQDALHGRDGMLATLGVTGSGKSHTILGNKSQRGMTQLALDLVFSSLENKIVDYNRLDMSNYDYSEALVYTAAGYFQQLQKAIDAGFSAGNRPPASMTTPDEPLLGGMVGQIDEKSVYAVIVSMYELYNDRIFDLLDETAFINPGARRRALVFRAASAPSWDPMGTTKQEPKKVVAGLRKVACRTYSEALMVLEHAQRSRKVSATGSNSVSSRSHAFLQIEIKRFTPRGAERESSSLQIVDLAGAERSKNAGTSGDQLAEAGSINRSLMTLGQCLEAQQMMRQGKANTANWRSSKLTEVLFANSFSGVSRQRAVMCVTADPGGDYNSTVQILRYSAMAREEEPELETYNRPPTSYVSSSTVPRKSDLESPTTQSLTIPDPRDALISHLLAELQASQQLCRDLEERCNNIEVSVRIEMADEMDRQLDLLRKSFDAERRKEKIATRNFVDDKLEILKRGMEAEFSNYPYQEQIRDLEEENEILRQELDAIRKDMRGRSPVKKMRVITAPDSSQYHHLHQQQHQQQQTAQRKANMGLKMNLGRIPTLGTGIPGLNMNTGRPGTAGSVGSRGSRGSFGQGFGMGMKGMGFGGYNGQRISAGGDREPGY